ncbi:uncharacterized protein PAN0_002d1394 [Moesziomyces antarcticus]|uniref:uncharacterized protein n=1 Tax=Pseudozyma antarctica TaxID=84753 RepID=UPI0007197F52|nr:uncharacterized protein PAN0_002d1394 [Moesziomyces antarcticus]GAK63191.1 hypothetical protein PAN0_002d1394 [Moesziomyces antarcticus]
MRRVGRTAAWRRRPTAGKRTEPLEQTAAPRGWAGVRWEATTLAIAKRKSLFAEPQRGQRKRGSTRELWAPAEALQPGPARCSFCYRTHASVFANAARAGSDVRRRSAANVSKGPLCASPSPDAGVRRLELHPARVHAERRDSSMLMPGHPSMHGWHASALPHYGIQSTNKANPALA